MAYRPYHQLVGVCTDDHEWLDFADRMDLIFASGICMYQISVSFRNAKGLPASGVCVCVCVNAFMYT